MNANTSLPFPRPRLVWRENPNGPINWALEEEVPSLDPNCYLRGHCRVAGWVDRVLVNVNGASVVRYRSGVPAEYDADIDSDAEDLGLYDTLQAAERAVLQNIPPECLWLG